MSKEIKRESELNEAALEGVSGGGHSVESIQSYYCNKCVAKHSPSLCSGGAEQLAGYLDQHGGRGAVPFWQNCPFLAYNQR